MPRSAARNAAAYPPGPPPITATRRFEVFVIFFFLSSINIDHSCHPERSEGPAVSRHWQKEGPCALKGGPHAQWLGFVPEFHFYFCSTPSSFQTAGSSVI